jgi:hypothetical protein
MFSASSALPPANLADTILIHLQDPTIVVHQAALRAVSWHPNWFDEGQSLQALRILESHLRAYRDDKYQLDDICDGILSIGRRHERLKLLSLRLVESVFPTGEEHVDANIAEGLIRFCRPSERLAKLVAKDIGTYLGRHESDRTNGYEHTRQWMFEWLHELPHEAFQATATDLLDSAQEMARRDAWESCHFASLFGHFRAFRYEQNVLDAAANSLPEEPRFESFRESLRKLATIAKGNALLQAGDAETAEACFAKGKGWA